MLNDFHSKEHTVWSRGCPSYGPELTPLATGNIHQNAAGFSGQVKFSSQISFLIFAFIGRKVSFKACGKIANPHASYRKKPPVCPGVRVLAFPHETRFLLLGILKCLSGQGSRAGLGRGTLFAILPGKTGIRVEDGKGLWLAGSFKNFLVKRKLQFLEIALWNAHFIFLATHVNQISSFV